MEIITFASTSNVLRVKILDSASTVGAGKTGLTSASSGLVISTIADNEATATSYTVAGSTIETITTLGTYAAPTATKCRFKEVDSTNHPGVYELQIADARFAVTSAKRLLVSLSGATGMVQVDKVVELKRVDLQDTVRAGLTALPNAVAAASGGLPTVGTGTGQIQPSGGGVALSAAERQKELCRVYGVSGVVWCVSTAGNDSTGDGLTWDTAYALVSKAVSVASAGDLVLIGPGTIAQGSTIVGRKDGVSIRGAGTDVTTVTSTAQLGLNGCVFQGGTTPRSPT